MDIRDLLLKNVMIMDLKGTSKEAVIDEMVAKYHAEGIVTDENEYRQDILKREAESTTGIGEGIAMPHAKDSAVTRATVLFAKSDQGVDFNALDGQPVHLFFMIAAPEGANNEHLAALAALSSLLINPKLVADLKQAKTPDDVLALFGKAQAEKEAKDKAEEAKEKAQEEQEKADKQAEFKAEKRQDVKHSREYRAASSEPPSYNLRDSHCHCLSDTWREISKRYHCNRCGKDIPYSAHSP